MITKILVVDDHELIISGIKNMLAPFPHYEIIGETDNGLNVYNMCLKNLPDMIILDLCLPGMAGQEIISQLLQRWKKLQIIVFTAEQNERFASTSLKIGALGYVLKNSSQQVLLAAIQMVLANRQYIDPALNTARIAELMKNNDSDKLLTPRERQILKLITEGACNRIIGDKLSISTKTVETHRLNMMKKLGAHKVTDLVQWSYKMQLI